MKKLQKSRFSNKLSSLRSRGTRERILIWFRRLHRHEKSRFFVDCKLAAPVGFAGALGLVIVSICHVMLALFCGFFRCFRLLGGFSSSETQGRLAGRGNKLGKEMKRRTFTSKAEKAPGNRLLSDHFQTALPMLPPDWAEKCFVLFCPIGEQQLLRHCGVFLHDDFRIAMLALFVYQRSACEGNFHFNFLRERRNIEIMMT